MVKKLIFSLLVLILLVQVISAIDTEVTIETLPNHDVNINFLDPDHGTVSFETFNKNSGELGEIFLVFSSNAPEFDITVFVMEYAETIVYERFDDNTAGESLYLSLFPGDSEIIKNFEEVTNQTLEENSTINETLEENEIETGTEAEITGSAIFGDEGIFYKTATYIVIGVIILLGVGVFVFFKLKKKSKIPKEIKVKKLSDLQDEKKEKLQNKEEIIEDAERKIKEAQEDIRKIRNEDRIKEAKKKLIEDEKELMKLREGKE